MAGRLFSFADLVVTSGGHVQIVVVAGTVAAALLLVLITDPSIAGPRAPSPGSLVILPIAWMGFFAAGAIAQVRACRQVGQVEHQLTVAALIIQPLGVFFCAGKPREILRILCFFPQQFLTKAVQYLAILRHA
jgi:hypothetical protein